MLVNLLQYAAGYNAALSLVPLIILVFVRKRAGASLPAGLPQWLLAWAVTWLAMTVAMTIILFAWAVAAAGEGTAPGWVLSELFPGVIGYLAARQLFTKLEGGHALLRHAEQRR